MEATVYELDRYDEVYVGFNIPEGGGLSLVVDKLMRKEIRWWGVSQSFGGDYPHQIRLREVNDGT